jgi:hypothetical protein
VTELVAGHRLRTAGVSNGCHTTWTASSTKLAPFRREPDRGAPHFANTAACDWTAVHDIRVEAWSPLGQGEELDDLDDPLELVPRQGSNCPRRTGKTVADMRECRRIR